MTISIALACVVVILVTGTGFNQPGWSRSFTTAFRYRAAQGAYVAVYLIIFLTLYLLFSLAYALGAGPAQPQASMAEINIIWASLLLTLAIRVIPVAGRFLRQRAHRWAEIPDCAHRLTRVLVGAKFDRSGLEDDARAVLAARGIVLDSDWPADVKSAQKELLSATELFLQIRQWDNEPRAAEFALEAKQSIDLLRNRFDRLSFRVSRVLESIERLGDVRHLYCQHAAESTADRPLDGLLRKLVNDMIDEVFEDIRAFHADACLLTARATLAMRLTRHGRDSLLAGLGFRLKPKEGGNTLYLLAVFAVFVVASLWTFLHFVSSSADSVPSDASFLIIALNIFAAIAVAVIPKRHWGFANSGLWQRTPVWFVFGAGVCAMIFAVAVYLGVGASLYGSERASDILKARWPFLAFAFANAAVTAWLIQDHRWHRVPSVVWHRVPSIEWHGVSSTLWRRVLDSLTWGAVLTVAFIASVSMKIAAVSLGLVAGSGTPPPGDPLWVTLGTVFLFGAGYGLFIPESVRAMEAPRPKDTPLSDLETLPDSLRRFVE